MNILKKILILFLFVGFMVFMTGSQTVLSTTGFVPVYDSKGNPIYYKNSNFSTSTIQVEMPATYQVSSRDFRAVWVTPLTGDISSFTSEAQYKAEILRVFEVMEFFKMNALIFHVRIMNDALYDSDLNRWSIYYNSNPTWDALPWIIEECHKRGIEFHAWMNPYRVTNSYSGTVEQYAATVPNYNVATNPTNLIKSTTGSIILNPGEPAVRTFLINTVMELMERYDVDGIHFDDYFYISNIDDSSTRSKYNPNGLSLEDWRRHQVDVFIRDLYIEMTNFNLANNKAVQLGISPSGIFRNGNGIVTYDENGHGVSNGSTSRGFAHYGNYLYADTMKWVREGWIDYLVPQVYWAMDHPQAPHADIISWWAKMFKNENVNLYLGLGLYANVASGETYGWKSNPVEAETQMTYNSQFPEFKGTVVFSFQHLSAAMGGGKAFSTVKSNIWNKPTLLPEINTIRRISPSSVNNLAISTTPAGYRLDWDEAANANKYAIYRSEGTMNYGIDQLIKVVGDIGVNGKISFIDQTSDPNNTYTYGIRSMSRTNTLSSGKLISSMGAPAGDYLSLGEIQDILVSDNLYAGDEIRLRFGSLNPLDGGKPTYEIFVSSDQVQWNKVTSAVNPVTTSMIYTTQRIVLGNFPEVYVKITAFNAVGYSESDIITLKLLDKYGPINHLTHFGEPYNNQALTFQWWGVHNKSGLTYELQYSSDEMVWNSITSADNPIRSTSNLYQQDFTLPDFNTRYFYRVIARDANGSSISNTIRIDGVKYLGEFRSLTFDGETIRGPVYVNEMDQVQIAWRNLSEPNVNYVTRISTDLKTWRTATSPHVFNSYQSEVSSIVTAQNFEIGYLYYKLYVRIEATSSAGTSFSPIIEIMITLDYHYLEDLLTYMANEQQAMYNQMNIYG